MMHKDDASIISELRQMADDMPDGISVTISKQGGYMSFDAPTRLKVKRAIIISILASAAIWWGLANASILMTVVMLVALIIVSILLTEPLYSVKMDKETCEVSTGFIGIERAQYSWKDYQGPLVYMQTLNGREPSPKDYCLKFSCGNRIKIVRIANMMWGKTNSPRENLKKMSELWDLMKEFLDLENFDTDIRMSGRNARFS
jgi:hypothetical protein